MNAVSKAIESVGLADLAKACGVSYQAVRKWESGRIPAERAVQVSKVTGIPLNELRPDLWSEDSAA